MTRATRHDPEERFRWKTRLIRRLYEQEWAEADVVELFSCLDRLLHLPDELGRRFWQELSEYEKEKRMPYVTSVERFGFERGMQEGILQGVRQGREQGIRQGREQGIQQGREHGIQQGLRQGEARALARLLVHRFDALPLWVDTLLESASLEQLTRWLDRIVNAARIEDVFVDP